MNPIRIIFDFVFSPWGLGAGVGLILLLGIIANIMDKKKGLVDIDNNRQILQYPLDDERIKKSSQLIFDSISHYICNDHPEAASFYIKKWKELSLAEPERLFDLMESFFNANQYTYVLFLCEQLQSIGYADKNNKIFLYGVYAGERLNLKDGVCAPENLIPYIESNYLHLGEHTAEALILCHVRLGMDIERIIGMCREIVERDRREKVKISYGLIALRHFLQIQPFLAERRQDESMGAFAQRMANRYLIGEWQLHYACTLHAEYSVLTDYFTMTGATRNECLAWKKAAERGRHAALLRAIEHPEIFSLGCKNYSFSNGTETNFQQDLWKLTLAALNNELKSETAALSDGWYDQAARQAESIAAKLRKTTPVALEKSFWRALCMDVIGERVKALPVMREAAQLQQRHPMMWMSMAGYPNEDGFYNDELEPVIKLSVSLGKQPNAEGYARLIDWLRTHIKENEFFPEFIERVLNRMETLPGSRNLLVYLCTIDQKDFDEIFASIPSSSPRSAIRLVNLAAALRHPESITLALNFVEHDLDPSYKHKGKSVSTLLSSARLDDIDALTALGGLYRNTPEINKGEKCYLNIGEAILDHAVRVCRLMYIDKRRGEEYLRKWYYLESAIRRDEEAALNLFQIGLDNCEPYFCANAYWYKEELDLSDHEIGQYLNIAQKHGYNSNAVLLDMKAHREKTLQQIRAAEKKAKEELDRKRQALNDELDWLERDLDASTGGSGHTLSEKATAGNLTPEEYADFLRDQAIRDAILKSKFPT